VSLGDSINQLLDGLDHLSLLLAEIPELMGGAWNAHD
jgi:hypothetical protein